MSIRNRNSRAEETQIGKLRLPPSRNSPAESKPRRRRYHPRLINPSISIEPNQSLFLSLSNDKREGERESDGKEQKLLQKSREREIKLL